MQPTRIIQIKTLKLFATLAEGIRNFSYNTRVHASKSEIWRRQVAKFLHQCSLRLLTERYGDYLCARFFYLIRNRIWISKATGTEELFIRDTIL